MREIAILTFISLDGVMQGPMSPEEDSSNGFTQGGWAAPYLEHVMPQVMQEAMSEPYDLLFGRLTYDMFSGHWPNEDEAENPVAKILNNAKKHVVTTSPKTNYDWRHTNAISGDVVTQIENLKQQDGPLLQIHGSHGLIQTLLAHNLIDEFRLWTFPVLLGNGKRLFSEGTVPANLNLIKADKTENGVTMNFYRPNS